ncbi:MAG: beta-galactosidase, partial [Clostridia bacterium]|nr:beta-galactosidase [Clostridia bacterium]
MKLELNESRLTPGAALEGNLLILPAEGGGIQLPELQNTEERWLNITLEVPGDHAQAFELRVFAEEEEPRVIVRFGINPGWQALMAVDLNWLDGHILFPGHRVGTQKVVCHGSRIDRKDIRKALLVSMPSFAPVRVRLSGLSLDQNPGDPLPVPAEKWIDRFGQYTRKDWPGKIRTESELTEVLRKEAAMPDAYIGLDRTRWGGFSSLKLTDGNGFFGKCRSGSRWYLTDPDGYAFFSLGPDCVTARCDGRIDGLESLLEEVPSPGDPNAASLLEPMKREFGETERGPARMLSFERWNLLRAFGPEWYESWQRMVTGQLKRMGMNSLGNWSDPALFGRMPYVTSLPEFPATRHLIFRDFPDVLSPEYREEAKRCARALAARKEDPRMIGYFLRNEPSWAFVDDLLIADEVLRDPQESACKTGLIAFLRERYGSAENLNRAWHTSFTGFEDLETPVPKASALSPDAARDMRDFSAVLTEAYMRIPAQACRAVDPNHLILGMRWAWISDPLLVSGWDCFDVFSINCYAVDPTPALERVRTLGVDLPVMIGEFHFGALDAGLPATGLEAVENQEERGKAFRYYSERVAAHPNGVGCHWFQCYDQFALGRFDGENYNIGLF